MEKLLNIKEVAGIIGVKESTIRSWVFVRKIPFKKIHGVIRFDPDEIRKFIDGKWVKKRKSYEEIVKDLQW